MDDNQNQGRNKNLSDLFNLGQAAKTIVPTLGWAAGATVGAVIFTIGIALIFQNQGAASETSSTPPPVENSQSVPGGFNITGATDTQKQEIIIALSDALRFPTYSKLLTTDGVVNIEVSPGCGGYVSSSNTISLSASDCPVNTKFFLIHETGHIIAYRNDSLFTRFPYFDWINKDGALCYDSDGYLKTYPRSSKPGVVPRTESFAEAATLFLYPKAPLQNFSTQCPTTYNWIKDNIYDERKQ